MQVKNHIHVFRTAPDDQPVQQLETFRVVALKQAVMQRNSNGVEAGPMQERDVLTRDVVLAVLLPECGRPFRPQEFQHQRADLTRDRKSTRLNSSHGYISYAVFCLKKKKIYNTAIELQVLHITVIT